MDGERVAGEQVEAGEAGKASSQQRRGVERGGHNKGRASRKVNKYAQQGGDEAATKEDDYDKAHVGVALSGEPVFLWV